MELLEIERRETMRREELAAQLHALADSLARHNNIEFDRGGARVRLKVPDMVQVKVELEVETDERELEIEIKW